MRSRTLVATAAATLSAAALAVAPLHSADAARPVTHSVVRRDVAAPVVTVTTSSTGTTLSTATVAPGGVVFDLVGKGGVDIVTFKPGYTLANFSKDVKNLFKGKVKVVRRVDKKAVFWGGTAATSAGAQIGMDLPAGSYYVLNVDKGTLATLTVTGTPTGATLPAAGGTVKYVHEMSYKLPKSLPRTGWLTFDNKSKEPHFTDMEKVKKGTTTKQVSDFLASGAQGEPKFDLGESVENLPLSPGHSFQQYVAASKGEYVALCFWPSKKTGMPHAFMGMFGITTLK